MKSVALFCALLTIACSMQVKSSFQLSIESKILDLKKTGWGRVAVGLLELQIMTGGPMDELVVGFQNLIRDLNFKIGSEQEEYRWAAAENFELEKTLNENIRDARVRFGVASAHLENTLYPERARLEELIRADEQLIADTEAAMEKATFERNSERAAFESAVEEHNLALEAVAECVELVAGLQSGGASFVQVTKTKKHIKQLQQKLSGKTTWAHLAKVLVELAQDFADKSATAKVMDLLEQLGVNLQESRVNLDKVEAESQAAYDGFMAVCRNTIASAEARLVTNNAALDVVNAKIALKEEQRDTAKFDWDTNQADLDAEEARWAAVQAEYEDLIAEMMKELDAVSRCIDVFSNASVDAEMMSRLDW